MTKETRWYALKVKGGCEEKVKNKLESLTSSSGGKEQIETIYVPSQKVYVTKNGKAQIKKQTFGFILIALQDLSREIKEMLQTIPEVKGFWSHTGYGVLHEPTPLPPGEVDRMLGYHNTSREIQNAISFAEGEEIEITEGLFKGKRALITNLHTKRRKIEATIEFFGKKVKTELSYQQVKKI